MDYIVVINASCKCNIDFPQGWTSWILLELAEHKVSDQELVRCLVIPGHYCTLMLLTRMQSTPRPSRAASAGGTGRACRSKMGE